MFRLQIFKLVNPFALCGLFCSSIAIEEMPMNHSIAGHEPVPKSKKRPHPNDDEQDAPEPVHKLFISERFAKDLAAMSLNHKDDMANGATTTTTTIPATGVSNTAHIDGSVYEPSVPQRQRTGSVVVIDNINDFLSDDEDDSNNMETDFLLPMQKRPWDQKYHIPDFVLQTSRT